MNHGWRLNLTAPPPNYGNSGIGPVKEANTMASQSEIARVCHEANRAYCAALGDHSQPAWEDAPQWQRDSAEKGVLFIFENPDASPSASHESWLAEKEADGWRYGPEKDPVAKTHPCFIDYEMLPVEQRAKDYIFGAIARTMLAK